MGQRVRNGLLERGVHEIKEGQKDVETHQKHSDRGVSLSLTTFTLLTHTSLYGVLSLQQPVAMKKIFQGEIYREVAHSLSDYLERTLKATFCNWEDLHVNCFFHII